MVLARKSKYKTVAKRAEGFYKEKGSKFIAYAQKCYSEDDVKVLLEEWKKEHHQARHLCYAYRLGLDKAQYRANDDGEPSNSAGAPILGQIKSFDLTNILIGVIRYYGGTKLGVGGLMTAYKTAAKDALENGDIVELEVFDWYSINFGYSDMPEMMNKLKSMQLELHEKEFTETCSVILSLPINRSAEIIKELKSLETVEVVSKGIY